MDVASTFETARLALTDQFGERPTGLVMLDSDQRVAASDAGATSLFGPDPHSVLRSQIYSLVDEATAKAVSRAVRGTGAVQHLGVGRSGTGFTWAITTVKKRQFVGVWTVPARSEAPVEPKPQEDDAADVNPLGLLDLNRRLSVATAVSGVAEAVVAWIATQPRGRKGFLAVFDGREFAIAAAWPGPEAVVRSLRFPLAASQAGMFGLTLSPSESEGGEPYVKEGAGLWVVAAHYAGRLECVLGDSLGEHAAESLAQVLAPHLSRIRL